MIDKTWKERVAKAGSLISVSEGCYSDYAVTGFFVVLRDFTPGIQLDEFLAAKPGYRGLYEFSGAAFMGYLIQKGLLLEIPFGTLHLGDYSEADGVTFQPAATE